MRGYAGSGPFMIISETKGPWPVGKKITRANHYDNPARRDKRLYALDRQGRFIAGRK